MKNDAIKNGIRPRKGMWLVSHERRRVYGEIQRVTRDAVVWWSEEIGMDVKTAHEIIQRSDSTYAETCPAGYDGSIVKECSCCQMRYTEPKWRALVYLGEMNDGDGSKFELRNCPCGSTLAVAK